MTAISNDDSKDQFSVGEVRHTYLDMCKNFRLVIFMLIPTIVIIIAYRF
jgi:hypothetical protein